MKPLPAVQKCKRTFSLLFVALFVSLMLSLTSVNPQLPVAQKLSIDSQNIPQSGSRFPAAPRFGAYPFANGPGITMYDEQVGASFTQNFNSLAYTLTAVAQTGTDGYGPAYLLNGLGNTGYWYQVGLAYDWDANVTSGFQLAYQVFNPSGNVVLPVSGGGGIAAFSPVNAGDTILLSLTFSNGNVIMSGTDQTSGAKSQVSYTAAGATYFAGTPSSVASSQGFFSGLMTEWYHTTPYYGGENKVTYTTTGSAIQSAWLWIDEFSVSRTGIISGLFGDYTHSPVVFSNPAQLQSFSSNGAYVAANATQVITGQTPTVTLMFGYSVTGAASGLPAPTLTYISGGTPQTATLTQSSQGYSIDIGSVWSVTNPLSTSSSTKRWQTNQTTTGTAASAQTINFVFYQQYQVTFSFNVTGGGSKYSLPSATCQQFGSQITAPMNTQVWADSAQYSYPVLLTGSSSSERWDTKSASGTISSSGSISASYFHQYLTTTGYSIIGGGTPASPSLTSTTFGLPLLQTLTTEPQDLWIDSDSLYTIDNHLAGSTVSERWQSSTATSGQVNSSSQINIPYYHQFYVTTNINPATGGSTSVDNGWFNAGSAFQSTASSNEGWQFENWSGTGQGSYSGSSNSAIATVNAPLTETVTFYPGFTITVSNKLSVSYNYGATNGMIDSSTPETIFAPSGTEIQLTAKPKMFIYSFAGWTGSVTDKNSSISTVLDTPQSITADFSYNYVNIGLIAAGVIIVIAAAIILVTRRKNKPPVVISG
jgi:hypothetical protein